MLRPPELVVVFLTTVSLSLFEKEYPLLILNGLFKCHEIPLVMTM